MIFLYFDNISPNLGGQVVSEPLRPPGTGQAQGTRLVSAAPQ